MAHTEDIILQPKNSIQLNQETVYLQEIGWQLHYMLLRDQGNIQIKSPIHGYLNIQLIRGEGSCICPYFYNHNSYVIRGGENVIHPTREGDTFEWKNIYEQNIGLLIFIPEAYLKDFDLQFQENSSRFHNGLLSISDNRIQLLQKQLIELHNTPSLLHQLKIQAALVGIIANQIESLLVQSESKQDVSLKSHYDKIMLAKKLIDTDVSQNFTIADLAKAVGTNEQYLKKYFKRYLGKTVMSYITDRKMNFAKELIMSGDYRVVDVARMTGYKHATHFTTAFKKYFGFIPNSLRYALILGYGWAEIVSESEKLIHML